MVLSLPLVLASGCAQRTPVVNSPADTVPIASSSATLIVHGMSCPLCASNVDKQLLSIRGITSADVDMGTGAVTIKLAPGSTVTRAQLADAVDKSGFTLTEVRVP